jgi:hypothetical protein
VGPQQHGGFLLRAGSDNKILKGEFLNKRIDPPLKGKDAILC